MRLALSAALPLLLCASLAHAGWDEGVAAFAKKDYQGAVSEFEKLVNEKPEGPQGHYMLGLSYAQLERKEEALHHLRKAYDLNPNDLSIKVALGRAYHTTRRHSDSSELLETVDPDELPAGKRAAFHLMRGLVRLGLDQEDGAVRDLAMASELTPGDPDTKRAYIAALIRRARSAADEETARPSFELAIALASELVDSAGSYDNLMLKIEAELGAGRYTNAIDTGQRALAAKGGDWLAHYYLGQAYASNGQFREAEAHLEDAATAATDPGDKQRAWRQLGLTLEKQGELDRAIAAYQNADDDESVERLGGGGAGQ